MKRIATIVLTASMAIGSMMAIAEPAAAVPIAPVSVAHSSDVLTVRDDRHWRHHRRWDGDRRHWRHGRGDWRQRQWHRDRYWHDRHWHHRHGVVIRF